MKLEASASEPYRGSILCLELHDQWLLLPCKENELVLPRRVRLCADLHFEIPDHARKGKADFKVGKTNPASGM